MDLVQFPPHRRWMLISGLTVMALLCALVTGASAAPTGKSHKPSRQSKFSPAVAIAVQYAEAIAKGDRSTFAKLDFACLYRMAAAGSSTKKGAAPARDHADETCWKDLAAAHAPSLAREDVGMDAMWPSNGNLVFYRERLDGYPASAFVMDALGLSPPGTGLHLDPAGTATIPSVSFRLRPNGRTIAVPATLVKLTVTYQDPLTAPISYAPGSYQFTSTTERPQLVLKAVTVQWVVVSGLKRHGFASDWAVVNLPVSALREGENFQEAVPFSTERSRVVADTPVWWSPGDVPGLLIAAAARAAAFPELRDRVALLNRILLIDPNQPEALTILSRHLYDAILKQAGAAHNLHIKDPALAVALNEFYWNTYAQTIRTDLSLGMVMGGFAQPTTADYLYRMIPAMERLAKVRPEQLDNRTHLGTAYRWNNDQQAAIATHEALVNDIPPERTAARAQALIELAWSRINQVAWNRRMEDPEIQKAFDNAAEAFKTADLPVDKFMAAYTMAYSMLYMPSRDNKGMLEHLTEAKQWYDQIPNESPAAWQYMLESEQLKAVLDADPAFKPLLAASSSS
ncbi:MAG TPA: hypothetical protein VHF07_07230 [Nitrospiraceae bacterium]|nr:hypothetical protein [Nitrospiraceae bacterium]